MKILFIDVDGPLLPQRIIEAGATGIELDPVACHYIKKMAELKGVRLVISSGWRYSGLEFIQRVLRENGIDPRYLHEDWQTDQFKKGGFDRSQEIQIWLDRHPEVTHWAAVDDDSTIKEMPGAVVCSWENGLLIDHYERLNELLELNHLRGEQDVRDE